jgi:fibro-slime domain-containing protein
MIKSRIFAFTVAGLLAIVIAVTLMQPAALTPSPAVANPPDEIRLQGRVRDFKRAHPDFDVPPGDSTGHSASLAAFQLDAESRPARAGAGYRVMQQWKDDQGRNIAPHLFGGTSGALYVEDVPNVAGSALIDTWDSTQGPYSEASAGPTPEYDTGGALPLAQGPMGMPPSTGDLNLNGASVVLTGDRHCNNLRLLVDATVEIIGDVRILCDSAVSLGQSSRIVLAPNASLELYFNANFDMHQGSTVNVGGMPEDVRIYNLGNSNMNLAQYAELVARVVNPRSEFRLGQDTEFYGTYAGESLHLDQESAFHFDTRWFAAPCGGVYDDERGNAGESTNGAITSADTFATWYRDVLGTNLSTRHVLILTRDSDGIYRHDPDPLYPIDDQLFGNEGLDHNLSFTMFADATFVYEACAGQYIAIGAGGDAWISIGDQVGIDLGGLRPNRQQVLDLDRLELTDGETYTFRLFHAHRSRAAPWFSLETNIVLEPGPDLPVTEGFD